MKISRGKGPAAETATAGVGSERVPPCPPPPPPPLKTARPMTRPSRRRTARVSVIAKGPTGIHTPYKNGRAENDEIPEEP